MKRFMRIDLLVSAVLFLGACAIAQGGINDDRYSPPDGVKWPSLDAALLRTSWKGSSRSQGSWMVEVKTIDNKDVAAGKKLVITPGYHYFRVVLRGKGSAIGVQATSATSVDVIAKPGREYAVTASFNDTKAVFRVEEVSVLEGAGALDVKPVVESPEIQALRAQAEQGEAKAQYLLGLKYYLGHDDNGKNMNYFEANKWFLLAANQGDSRAQYMRGNHYVRGLGGEENAKEGVRLILKSAEQGNDSTDSFLDLIGRGYYGWDARSVLKDEAEAGNNIARKYIK